MENTTANVMRGIAAGAIIAGIVGGLFVGFNSPGGDFNLALTLIIAITGFLCAALLYGLGEIIDLLQHNLNVQYDIHDTLRTTAQSMEWNNFPKQ